MKIFKAVYFIVSCLAFPALASTMKVCIDHYPPLQILSEQPKGESIAALKELAKLLGHNLEFIPGPNFARCLRMLELGQVDVLAGLVDDPSRYHFANFVPYQADDNYIFVSHIDSPDIVNFDDLSKYVVGITKNTKYFKELEYEQAINKVLIKDIASGLKMLLRKRIDVIVTSKAVLQSTQSELGDIDIDSKIKVNPYRYHTQRDLCFALSKTSKLAFSDNDILKIKQAAHQQIFSKAIEAFIIENPELYSTAEQ
jgi:ABC-type amino acid transport substrate-binding protein